MPGIDDVADLRSSVRALMPDQIATVLPDARLDSQLCLGLGRLNKDDPEIKSALLPTPTNNVYDLSAVAGWEDGFSEIRGLWAEFDSQYVRISKRDYNTWTDPATGDPRLAFQRPIQVSSESFQFSAPWIVQNLEGATSTTLPRRLDNALIFICTAFACYSLATGAAGRKSSNIPGDLVAYIEESRRYREVGRTFENQYAEELGMNPTKLPAAGAISVPHRSTLSSGLPFVTHRA